jgi:REP element-mobilizing transposase RayT
MPHTHAWVLVHCVFSTKQLANLIPDPDELCRYLTGVARAKNVTLVAAGGTANHIHLLIAVPPTMPLSKAVQELKGNSSRWLSEHGVRFAWQEGYGAFSVSQSHKRFVAPVPSIEMLGLDILSPAGTAGAWGLEFEHQPKLSIGGDIRKIPAQAELERGTRLYRSLGLREHFAGHAR